MDLFVSQALSLFGVPHEKEHFTHFEIDVRPKVRTSSAPETGSELRSCLKTRRFVDFRKNPNLKKAQSCRHVTFENAAEECGKRVQTGKRYAISRAASATAKIRQ